MAIAGTVPFSIESVWVRTVQRLSISVFLCHYSSRNSVRIRSSSHRSVGLTSAFAPTLLTVCRFAALADRTPSFFLDAMYNRSIYVPKLLYIARYLCWSVDQCTGMWNQSFGRHSSPMTLQHTQLTMLADKEGPSMYTHSVILYVSWLWSKTFAPKDNVLHTLPVHGWAGWCGWGWCRLISSIQKQDRRTGTEPAFLCRGNPWKRFEKRFECP